MILREQVPAALDGERLDRVLAMVSGRPRAEVAELIARGAVRVRGAVATNRSVRVREGDVVEVELPERAREDRPQAEPEIEVRVVHEDEHLVVVDKPAGLVVHPGAGHARHTLVNGLLARYPELAAVGDPRRPGIVHRLDKGTSGLLMVARSERAFDALVEALSARRVQRRYRCLVWGALEAPRGLIDAPIGRSERDRARMAVSQSGRPARTRYRVLATYRQPVEVSELECELESGRTHQVRVHLSSIGHPVVGDSRYGGARGSFPLGRPFLHAEGLALEHPVTGERLELRSELPADLMCALGRLSPPAGAGRKGGVGGG